MRRASRLMPFAIFAFALISGAARGAVELRQLNEFDLRGDYVELARHGVLAGDVALGNDLVKIAVFTSDRPERGVRSGQAIMLNSGMPVKDPIKMTPAPGGWQRPEVGRNDAVAVLRFVHDGGRWSAELVYQVRDGSPWVDVITTIRNTSSNQTLELPIVDELTALAQAKVTVGGDGMVKVTQPGDATITSILPVGGANPMPRRGEGGAWWVGYPSGDPDVSTIKMVGLKIFNRKSPEANRLRPFAAMKGWSKDLKDDENWHRVAPGEERSVKRRLVISANEEESKALTDFAKQEKGPSFRIVPSSPGEAKPDVASGRSGRKAIVGKLRGGDAPVATPASTVVVPTPHMATQVKNTRPAAVKSTSKKPTLTPTPDLPPLKSPRDATESPALPAPAIPDIVNLPPPVE